jgi:hypothetical protein
MLVPGSLGIRWFASSASSGEITDSNQFLYQILVLAISITA